MNKLPALLLLLLPGLAAADGIALTGKIGTLGYGGELTTQLSDAVNLRFGLNAYNWTYNTTESNVEYDARFRLQTATFVGDWFPIQDSIFRVSAGLAYNNNHLDLTARPGTGGTYNINGTDYGPATIGTLRGKLTVDKVSPYIGVGWGNAFSKERGWTFNLEVGALYQGKPKFRLSSDSAACNAACQTDIAAEQESAESELKHYRWWPAVSAGAAYRF